MRTAEGKIADPGLNSTYASVGTEAGDGPDLAREWALGRHRPDERLLEVTHPFVDIVRLRSRVVVGQ